jgi:hypothetical protein
MWSYLVVLDPHHVQLFGCCEPRHSGVIWLLWTQIMWYYLVVLDKENVVICV